MDLTVEVNGNSYFKQMTSVLFNSNFAHGKSPV